MNALIILNYNDYKSTIKLSKKMESFDKIDKILIVDNLSTNESVEQIKKIRNEKIDIIETGENLGYANGNNYGLKYIKKYNPEVVFIANPDVSADETVIEGMYQFIHQNSDVGVVGPNSGIKSAWTLPTFKSEMLYTGTVVRHMFSKYIKRNFRYSEQLKETSGTLPVDVVLGSLIAIKYDSFEAINFFDSRTFLYYEEDILGYKIKQAKLQSYILLDLHAQHIGGTSTSSKKMYDSFVKYLVPGKLLIYNNYLQLSKSKKILLRGNILLESATRKIIDVIQRRK